MELVDVEVRTPSGDQLIEPLGLRLEPGGSLSITGRSGSGKTTLLRSLALMWPFASGTLRGPADQHETMFLSQLPYVRWGICARWCPIRLALVSFPTQSCGAH